MLIDSDNIFQSRLLKQQMTWKLQLNKSKFRNFLVREMFDSKMTWQTTFLVANFCQQVDGKCSELTVRFVWFENFGTDVLDIVTTI